MIPAGFSLEKGERVEWHGRLAYRSNLKFMILGLLTIWIYGLGLIFFLIVFLRVKSTEYLITNQRLYTKFGLIGRRISEAKIEWITDIRVQQGFLARLLNVGNLMVNTPGSNIMEINFIGIVDPTYLKSRVDGVSHGFKDAEQIRQKLRKIEEEYEFGRLEQSKYSELSEKYRGELSKYEVTQ